MATAPVNDWNVPKRTTALVLFCCWMAILAEGYDVGVLGAVLPALAEYKEWNLSPLQLGGLGSYALAGMLVGALFIGTLSDLVGRKKMLLASMVIFTLTQAGAAWAPTPELFGLFRFIGGLGMGGVIPVAAALTIEYSAPASGPSTTASCTRAIRWASSPLPSLPCSCCPPADGARSSPSAPRRSCSCRSFGSSSLSPWNTSNPRGAVSKPDRWPPS